MRGVIIAEACIAATIEVESPDHAPRMGGLVTESVCAAQSIFIKFFVKPIKKILCRRWYFYFAIKKPYFDVYSSPMNKFKNYA